MREVIDESPASSSVASPHTSETLLNLIRVFLLDAPDNVELVLKAVSDHDYAGAEERAGTLKHAAADLGALELHATCEQLQSACRTRESIGIQESGRTLRHDFEEVFGVLEDLLENYG